MQHKPVISLQALSLARIALGCLFLFDILYYKFAAFALFYGNNSMLAGTFYPNGVRGAMFSILNLINNQAFTFCWFVFSAALAVAYIVGYKTRYVAPLLWYAFYSICYKNVYITFGYDMYMLHLLFFTFFLPVSVYYSVNKQVAGKVQVSIAAVRLLYAQVALVYFLTLVAKHGFTWWDGYATSIMMADTITGNPISHALSTVKWLYMPLNYGVLFIEAALPVLIIITLVKKNVNSYIVVLMLLLHLPIQLLANVGLFSAVSLSAMVFYLSTGQINKIKFLRPKQVVVLEYSKPTASKRVGFIIIALCMAIGALQFVKTDSALNTKKAGKSLPDLHALQFEKFTILNQNWSMYAPNPPANVGWVTIEAKNAEGTFTDVFTAEPASGNEPQYLGWGAEKLLRFYMRYWHSKKTYNFLSSRWLKYHADKYNTEHPTVDFQNIYFTNYSRKVIPLKNNTFTTKDTIIRLNFNQLTEVSKILKK